jgi:hypothetical protein
VVRAVLALVFVLVLVLLFAVEFEVELSSVEDSFRRDGLGMGRLRLAGLFLESMLAGRQGIERTVGLDSIEVD